MSEVTNTENERRAFHQQYDEWGWDITRGEWPNEYRNNITDAGWVCWLARAMAGGWADRYQEGLDKGWNDGFHAGLSELGKNAD